MFFAAEGDTTLNWVIIGVLSVAVIVAGYFIVRFVVKQVVVKQKIFRLLLERKAREIHLKNEALEKSNMIQTRLISIISHDIISPLRFIHISSKNLIDGKNEDSREMQEEMLAEISHTSKELELLSTNIMNWIKYQNENRRMIKEQFDLHQMANQIFGIFQGLARQKNITFKNEVNTGSILYQYMEPVKIVLYNLILNALNFTEQGCITISGGESKKGILIKVKDEGKGMTKDQIDNVMSEHFIVSSANVDKRKGHGLGYLIIKDMLKFVDAKFVIKSKPGQGTSVTIFLPS
ncbi:hypothetical protein CJD36_021790 [Flavipsychrobacter stenotrophus]|uniref:histidine kinase n=1 Tax=Flavipsychrobacter stenotrophus TaxID=2077091 RepID=A0A2S7SPR5_9BACT|nr:HAMP domain-containing sensor histidine kinase [Flavipsychrobacter stenotrophus]PQJ08903.1 hypothetical protein CJD36_021790 [Flavipsychrobacter stenotrophus]